jgi:Domain of unknown function (DUF1707)
MPSRPPVRSVQDMSTATKGHPSGSLRVSDADRDRAIAELSEHYQAGRLTTEEFEDRTGRALRPALPPTWPTCSPTCRGARPP